MGAEDLHTVDDLVTALVAMRARRPAITEAITKLDEGVSGMGNAGVDLTGLPAPGDPGEAEAVRDRITSLRPEDPATDPGRYLAAFAAGGIVEERIGGVELASPSVQLRVQPGGTLELLSTHDQLLGGASGQSYLGCVFPADPGYSRLISDPARRIGERLAELGVLGRFAVDFVVVKDATGTWTPYAIELNLRKGGTTHPFLTLQFLTDGTYDADAGQFVTPTGGTKHLVATDHLEDEALKALTVDDLFDVVATRRLHFDQSRQAGVVLHMMSSVTEAGRIGLTAVADTADQARTLFDAAQQVLVDEARAALAEAALV
jgi:hypothetical protein